MVLVGSCVSCGSSRIDPFPALRSRLVFSKLCSPPRPANIKHGDDAHGLIQSLILTARLRLRSCVIAIRAGPLRELKLSLEAWSDVVELYPRYLDEKPCFLPFYWWVCKMRTRLHTRYSHEAGGSCTPQSPLARIPVHTFIDRTSTLSNARLAVNEKKVDKSD